MATGSKAGRIEAASTSVVGDTRASLGRAETTSDGLAATSSSSASAALPVDAGDESAATTSSSTAAVMADMTAPVTRAMRVVFIGELR